MKDFQKADTKEFIRLIRQYCFKQLMMYILSLLITMLIIYITAPISHRENGLTEIIVSISLVCLLAGFIRYGLFYIRLYIKSKQNGVTYIQADLEKDKKPYIKVGNEKITITDLLYKNQSNGIIYRTGGRVIGLFDTDKILKN